MRAPELPALVLLLVAALPAGAALDEPVSSLQADRLQLMANRHQREAGAGYEVHSLQAADGSLVREYVSSDGIVFAVSWSTRGKPRLDRLLGRHHASYEVAARQAMRLRAGVQHAALLQQGDLVVESTAHLNAYSGRAWLRSRLPPGMAGVR